MSTVFIRGLSSSPYCSLRRSSWHKDPNILVARGDRWRLLCKILSLLCQNAPLLLQGPPFGCSPLAFCAAPVLPSFSSQPSHLHPTWNPEVLTTWHLSHWQQRVPLLGMNHLLVCLKLLLPHLPYYFFFFFHFSFVSPFYVRPVPRMQAAAGTTGSVPGSSVAVPWCLTGSLLKALANYSSGCHCITLLLSA